MQPDHGLLLGLSDDDHPQYVRVADLPAELALYLLLGGGTMAGALNMDSENLTGLALMLGAASVTLQPGAGGNLDLADDLGAVRFRVLTNDDLQFRKADGSTVSLQWDETDDRWELLTDLVMGGSLALNGNTLFGPLDPTSGTHVGDRDFNDARYGARPLADTVGSGADLDITTSTWTLLDFWTGATTDPDALMDDDSFTAPETGFYIVSATVGFESDVVGQRAVRIEVEGVTVAASDQDASIGEDFITISMGLYLTATDDVTIDAFQSSGGDLGVKATSSRFSCVKVSD
jgi:hypothetical protein